MNGVLTLVVLGMLSQSPATTPAVAVTGSVINARTSSAVPDARVTLDELGLETRTTAEGRFSFAEVPPGRYTLTVSTIGFIFLKRAVTIEAAGASFTIPLAEGTGTYTDEVTVAVPDTDAGGTRRSVNSSLLQDLRGAAADDPMRAMQALPGVATGDDFRAEFSVRGSAYRQVGIVIDGTPTPLLFHALRGMEDSGSIAMINTDMLSGASLSTGAHPQRHGEWLGATLTFDVREGSRDRTAIRAAVSGTNASIVAEGPIGRGHHASWLFSARKSYIDWLIRKIAPEIDSTLGFADAQAKLAYDMTSRHHLDLLLIGGDATFFRIAATGGNQVKQSTSTSILGSASWRYSRNRLLLEQRVSLATNEFRNTGSIGQEQANGDTRSWSYRGDVNLALANDWTFAAGLRTQDDRMTQLLREFTAQGGGGLRIRREQRVNGVDAVASGWGELARSTASGTVTAGLRISRDERLDEMVVSPWIAAEHHVRGLTFSAGAGRTSQFPTLEHVGQTADVMNPLDTEHAKTIDVGVGGALPHTLRWKVVGFARSEANVLRQTGEDRLVNGSRVTASAFPLFASTLDGTSRGFDAVLERRAATGPLGWIGYSWAHTHHRDRLTGETFDGDFDQRHTLNAFVEQRLSYRLKVTAKFRYGSNTPLVGYFEGTQSDLRLSSVRNAVRLPTYARLDLSGSRTFTFRRSRMTLFVELMNVTNRRNYGATDGSIRANLSAVNYFQRLIPFLPSAGALVEF